MSRTFLVLLMLSACGADDAHHHVLDGGHGCAQELRADVYAPPMTRENRAGVAVALLEAQPAPPARFDNTWVLHSPTGAIAGVSPWMPDHGHGSQVDTVVTAADDPDTYRVEHIDLWMPGLWEVQVSVAGSIEPVVFAFCVDE